jgi:hypothetical protein
MILPAMSTGCCQMELAMRNFDVKKNSFLRKDLIESGGIQNPLLPCGDLKDKKTNGLLKTIYQAVIII